MTTLLTTLTRAFDDTAVGQAMRRRRRNRAADVFLISYPKCGRTWLRMMLGKAFALHFDLPDANLPLMEFHLLHDVCDRIPRLKATHDDNPQFKTPSELYRSKGEYRDARVIFLVRDIRDLVVSVYFQMTRRIGRYAGDLPAFLRERRGSVDSMIRFYNIWASQRHVPADFLLVRYEDLHADTAGELRRMLEFMPVADVRDDVITEAVEFARFENMRKLESSASINRLRPADKADPESYKTRRGKVGGYVDYLAPEQAAWLTDRMRDELDPIYRYP